MYQNKHDIKTMNKKQYSQPKARVDIDQQTQMLCTSVNDIEGADLNYSGAGTGPSRAPECDDWDVWGDE